MRESGSAGTAVGSGFSVAAMLLSAVVSVVGLGSAASARAAEPVPVCSVIEHHDAEVCTVPAPGLGETLPEGFDSGVVPSVVGVSYGPEPAQLLDLYLPAATTSAPVIVFFHGGGWISGTRDMVAQSLLRQVRRGYAVVSVDYRLAPGVQFPAPLVDAKTAVRWVKAHASQFGLRADRVFVAGSSAGGHLAAMVALTAGDFEPADLPPELAAQNSRVVGAFLEVGPLDLTALSREAHPWGPGLVAEFLGCPASSLEGLVTCSQADLAAASPINYVTRDDPPVYLGYGALDQLVPPATNAYPLARQYARLGLGRDAAVDEVSHQGHNLDIDGVNVTRLDAFFDGIPDPPPTRAADRVRMLAASPNR